MNLLSLIKNWKDFSAIWAVIQPFILKLIKRMFRLQSLNSMKTSQKYAQPTIDSLFKLKEKIKNTPNELDDYCFNQGVNAIETFANYLLKK